MLTSRSGSPGHSASPPPQSIEAVRRRARHRLIGAAVLVLVAVLGFPLLFDTQPRPIAVDIPIEIPSRQSPTPVLAAKQPDVPKVEAATDKAPAAPVAAGDSLAAREEIVEPAPPPTTPPAAAPVAAPATPAAVAKPVTAPAVAADSAPAAKTAEQPDDKAASAGNERIVVQVGAFAEVERAREARLKLERAGMKTYTHVAETPQGRRIRVRLGPFATRADADKAATKAKSLGLPAQLLWL